MTIFRLEKKKNRAENNRSPSRSRSQRLPDANSRPPLITKQPSKNIAPKKLSQPSVPALNLKTQLNTLTHKADDDAEAVSRTEGFQQEPAIPVALTDSRAGLQRDDRLAVVEDLTLGPTDHKPPVDDPNFAKLEPNSGIRLS